MSKYDQHNNQQIKYIEQDVKKFYKTYAYNFLHEASREMVALTKSLIDDYYNSYHPIRYKRTWNFENNSYLPYCDNVSFTKNMEAGVQLGATPESWSYPDVEESDNPGIVFNYNFQGYHGQTVNTGNIYTTLLQKVDDPAFYKKLHDEALKQAKKQKYHFKVNF